MIGAGVLLGVLLVGFQDPATPGPTDTEAEAAVEAFKAAIGRPEATEDDRVLAIRTLGQTVHPLTFAVIAPLMTERTATAAIRITAALVLADFRAVEETAAALMKAYRDPTNANLAMRAVRIRILQTLGALEAVSAAGVINAAILDRDPWIARAAARAAGKTRHISSIDPLIRRLSLLESKEGNRPVSGEDPVPDPTKGKSDPRPKGGEKYGDEGEKRTERHVVQASVQDALVSITRQRQSCAENWAKWWAQARRDFKVPK